MSWFIISVEKHQENKIEKILNKMGIEVFNPSIKGVKYWADQKKIIKTPLFSTYLFVRVEKKYRGLIFGISHVKGYVFQNGKPALLPNEEVLAIKHFLEEDSYQPYMLNRLIENKEINIQKWLLRSASGAKWITKNYVTQLIDDMDVVLKDKFRDVV